MCSRGKQERRWVVIKNVKRGKGVQRGGRRGWVIMLLGEGRAEEKVEGKFLPHLESLPVINSKQLVVSRSQSGKRREGKI